MDLQSEIREIANVPPFSRMIAITITGVNHELAFNFAQQLTKDIFLLKIKNIKIYGPADAKISKIRNKYRIRILIKVQKDVMIQSFLRRIIEKRKRPTSLNVTIDVDPINFT